MTGRLPSGIRLEVRNYDIKGVPDKHIVEDADGGACAAAVFGLVSRHEENSKKGRLKDAIVEFMRDNGEVLVTCYRDLDESVLDEVASDLADVALEILEISDDDKD